MATITLDKVRKVYGGSVEAVKGVSIDIADGEFIVLVGPSGCGKSTLLRMMAGLEEITTGDIKIGDRVVNNVDPADRDIAMVFQNYALYPHMSVYNNLAYGLKNRGMAKDEIDRRVKEAARILEIGDYLERKPRALSGGQRQRVAMGRAIVREPAAFLFDEPLSNLDAKLRVQMRVEIKRLQRSLGTTSVYVTHDQLEAMTLADRLVVLNGGNIEQIGAPIDVYDKPASTFVASFIGSPAMNLLKVKADGNGLALATGTGLKGANAKGRDAYTIGIRPEHLEVVTAPGEGEGLHLEASVNVLEPVGAESYLYSSFADGGDEILVRVSSHARHEPGEKLYLRAAPENVHYFDAETGRRID
ncbi:MULTISPECIES: sn-glycerol-3-phosphate import ATP-binding protein UgpC [Stappiaceae]|jgi:sn-glycerol 3-phosphate transport system ATP-binding protein|uniref:sn-glycerol-3-phosphate import ATP-binding protein UgpC n=4 Tax=Roseibium TaxID=150830 RepID=A0A0M6Y589_9HYPH|nr:MULTISPECIES: sn-glycerol-3-phosphate import ATP-binding protein UgpC [Stappiaceae]MCR9281902.1 sn-glycerol-3-phosphate import ATP-binding protein UgpC [Paracoccaceae bacterium]AMN55098.1 glycerol-3-phosphate transporter ATP-binding subunit [Labrenzia sp. CP4]AQQ03612.1 sn-glycerol-3-phosphate ABC transporter ATP-binding protein UgpC [Roseibium aggregatum]ERP96499.1 sugar ABC transporter ATPase [Labrenzia sp. C1B10]ERS06340.1 sugar ABC transporter ATPase [Labrenzia sp. C1B70]